MPPITENADEYYDTVEGGGFGPTEITIKDAVFRTDPAYQDGNVLLLALDYAFTKNDGERAERVELLSIGSGWETNDGGKTVEREDGKEGVKFNGSSRIGQWIKQLILLNVPKMDPRFAKNWAALPDLLLDDVEVTLPDKSKKGVRLPVALIGAEGGGQNAASQAPASTTANLAEATLKELDDLAEAVVSEGGTQDTFIERALELPSVQSDQAAEQAVMSGEVWEAHAK